MPQNRILLLTVILLFAALSTTGCIQQNSSLAAPKPVVSDSNPAEKPAPATTAAGQVEKAQKIIEKSPEAANGYNLLAAAYIRLARETGDFSLNSKAEAAVTHALELEPENPIALKFKTSLNLTFHRFADGRTMAINLLKNNPRDAFLYGALTDANVELGNYGEAVQAIQTMVDLKPDMASYARVSYVRSLHGDPKGAIQAMDTAATIADPADAEAQAWCLVHLGDELFKTGKYDLAEKAYDRSLHTFPNYHFALAGKGRARASLGDSENAIKLLTQSNNRVPNVENIIFLGDVYTAAGNLEEAKKQYDLAEFIEGKFGNLDNRRLALLWADHDVKLDEALAIARHEYDIRRDVFTADILAWCLSKKGEFAEAKKVMAEAMRLKTQESRFFYHAGMIEKGLGNKAGAARYLNLALQTNPAFDLIQAENARATLKDLK
jgi:tetratricopeptide (TPR) repeat protein